MEEDGWLRWMEMVGKDGGRRLAKKEGDGWLRWREMAG
jgi:hypothetical protein